MDEKTSEYFKFFNIFEVFVIVNNNLAPCLMQWGHWQNMNRFLRTFTGLSLVSC